MLFARRWARMWGHRDECFLGLASKELSAWRQEIDMLIILCSKMLPVL